MKRNAQEISNTVNEHTPQKSVQNGVAKQQKQQPHQKKQKQEQQQQKTSSQQQQKSPPQQQKPPTPQQKPQQQQQQKQKKEQPQQQHIKQKQQKPQQQQEQEQEQQKPQQQQKQKPPQQQQQKHKKEQQQQPPQHIKQKKQPQNQSPQQIHEEQESIETLTELPKTETNETEDSSEGDEIVDETGAIDENLLFENLPIHSKTKQGILKIGHKVMTPIQARSILPLLQGKDLIGSAKTGSGKTLAFLIPAVELLFNAMFKPHNGVGVIVLTPTRELALQIYGVVIELMEFHSQTHCIIMGGASRQSEEDKLARGVNLIVATPGRLVDHLMHSKGFVFKNLKCLVIDETDRMLDAGFEKDLREIIKILPKDRQTMLFSATQTEKVKDVARVCFKDAPLRVGVDDGRVNATVDTLEQGYVICPSEKRLLLLFTLLNKNMNKKVIVFFSCCASVSFHHMLFNYINTPVLALHGKMKQQKRTSTFFEFIHAPKDVKEERPALTTKLKGILLCTDVAARGLDIPAVDWIIQYCPPTEPNEYIHRVGRTARAGATGRALLFLLPTEIRFLNYLQMARVPLNEYDFPTEKLAKIQTHIESLVEKNFALYNNARSAYKKHLHAYASHKMQDVFPVAKLDLLQVARGFGFAVPPNISMSFMKTNKIVPSRQTTANQKVNKYRGERN